DQRAGQTVRLRFELAEGDARTAGGERLVIRRRARPLFEQRFEQHGVRSRRALALVACAVSRKRRIHGDNLPPPSMSCASVSCVERIPTRPISSFAPTSSPLFALSTSRLTASGLNRPVRAIADGESSSATYSKRALPAAVSKKASAHGAR